MEMDVTHRKPQSQPTVFFQDEKREQIPSKLFTNETASESGDSVATNGTTIPAQHDDLVLKSLETGVVRSKDNADQLEAMISQYLVQREGAEGGDDPDENTPLQVLREMHGLVSKLEKEKGKVSAELRQERKHVIQLQRRLDSLVEKRLRELPYAVQKEHEACAMDIVELQWHVAFKVRQETRIKAKLEVAERLNNKLKQDMAQVQESNPLLADKVDKESRLIVQLLQAHNTTASELAKTLQDKQNAEQKNMAAEAKAEKERAYLKKEIDGAQKTLAKAKKDLSDSEKLHATYIKAIEDTKQFTIDAEEATVVQIEKLESIRKLEEMQQLKVNDLLAKYEEACDENRRLSDENKASQQQLEDTKRKTNEERITLEAYLAKNEKRLREIAAENRNLKFENQDLQDHLDDNASQKEKDLKALERLYKDLEKNEEAYDQLKDEFFETESTNKSLSNKIQETDAKTHQREELLDEQIDSLKYQVKDEISKRAQLQTRIGEEKSNIITLQTDLKVQLDKLKKKVKETEAAVAKVRGQVEKMREKNETRQKQLSELLAALEKLAGIHKDTETKLTTKKAKLKPKLEQLKADDLSLSRQLDQMDHASEKLTAELREKKLGSVHLNKLIRVTSNEIEDYTVELAEVKLKLEDKQELVASLEATLLQINTRMQENKDAFKSLFKDREAFKTSLENDLAARLRENEELAAEYYSLQQKSFTVKQDLNRVYQQQIELEQTTKNLNQVKYFQEKFLFALAEFFKYRSLYYRAELSQLIASNDENEVELEAIRGRMESSLETMSTFLHAVMEGSLFREMKSEKMAELEDSTPQNVNSPEEVQGDDPQNESRNPQQPERDLSASSKYRVLPPIGASDVNSNNPQISVC